jgi:predicted aspartyl protease
MRFNGEWLQCDDGVVRPVIRADILTGDGLSRAAEFLVDTGADRTVISANVLESLNLQPEPAEDRIGGVGGFVDSVTVTTQIRLTRDDGGTAKLRGAYSACASYEALDMSVLGRDILEMLAVIVDRRANVVALLEGKHRYTVHEG